MQDAGCSARVRSPSAGRWIDELTERWDGGTGEGSWARAGARDQGRGASRVGGQGLRVRSGSVRDSGGRQKSGGAAAGVQGGVSGSEDDWLQVAGAGCGSAVPF